MHVVWLTVLITLDAIWLHRNKCMWENCYPNPCQVIHSIIALVAVSHSAFNTEFNRLSYICP